MNWYMDMFIENQPHKLCEVIKKNYKGCCKGSEKENYLSKSSYEYINLVKDEQFMLSDLYDEFALKALKIPTYREYFINNKFILNDIVFIDEESGIGDIKYFVSIDNKTSFHIKHYFTYWQGYCSEWGDYACCANITFMQ